MRHALTLPLAAACALCTLQAHAADQVRPLAPFTAVANAGPIDVHIEVGKPQSVTVSGDDDLVDALQTEVSGDELRLKLRHERLSFFHPAELHVTITVPQLTAFKMGGAGAATITHMSGDALDLRFGGAGSLKAEGSVRNLTLTVGGVGSIDTRELHAESAKVRVGGVGSVKVWASQSLDASVGGVGSLTYYGEPKHVSASGGGLGSISSGK
jgi:hypothetical protein